MKRIAALFLLVCLMLTACGEKDDADPDGTTAADVATGCGGETTAVVPDVREISLSDETRITWYGRNIETDGAVYFDYTASGFAVRFSGSRLEMTFTATECTDPDRRVYLSVITDGGDFRDPMIVALDEAEKTVVLELEHGVHEVRVLRRSEARCSRSALTQITTDGTFLEAPSRRERLIEFYGDSITCGYGNIAPTAWEDFSTSTEDGMQTYAYLTAEALNAECSVVAKSGIPVNQTIWGKSETIRDLATRASYYDDSAYEPKAQPDAVVIYGGVNDCSYLTGGGSTERALRTAAFTEEYTALLTALRQLYPDARIVCCAGMYDETFYIEDAIRDAIAACGDDRILYCELPACEAEDGIGAGHPTVASHEKAAAVLTEVLKAALGW